MGAPTTRLLPAFLEMPLRDTLRGVRTARDLSEELLRPAVRRMPSPIQRLLHDTAEIAHKASRRTVGAPPDLGGMAVAADVIGGTAPPRHAGETLAPLVVFGLEKALALDETTPLLSSGAGRARRSTFPLTVSGSASNRTMSHGTMYSGTFDCT